jgi:hypothetical protein
MTTCSVCHFETVMDDVMVAGERGHIICVRCYYRATGAARPMPASLQRAVAAALELISEAAS